MTAPGTSAAVICDAMGTLRFPSAVPAEALNSYHFTIPSGPKKEQSRSTPSDAAPSLVPIVEQSKSEEPKEQPSAKLPAAAKTTSPPSTSPSASRMVAPREYDIFSAVHCDSRKVSDARRELVEGWEEPMGEPQLDEDSKYRFF